MLIHILPEEKKNGFVDSSLGTAGLNKIRFFDLEAFSGPLKCKWARSPHKAWGGVLSGAGGSAQLSEMSLALDPGPMAGILSSTQD